MPVATFKGGVHPFEGKELTMDKPIKSMLPKTDLVYPVSQHIGAPAKPVVAVGDRVLAGQMIAEAGGFVSAAVYSAVSGKVKAIQERRLPNGGMGEAIVVENDGLYEEVEWEQVKPVEEMTAQEKVDAVRKAGVVGMGGAGFPTAVKLAPKDPEKIEYIIVNGAECEPFLTSDYRRMVENPELVVEGLKLVLGLFPNAKGIIAIENNKPEAIKIMSELVKGEEKISVQELLTKYPQGGERMLIYACTGREINSSMLPADAGCIVDNVETIVAIHKAITEGKPILERTVTITGDAIAEPCNFRVRLGTNFHDIIQEAGGFASEPAKIISGGPMMGFSIFDIDVPATKTSSALTCLTIDQASELEPSPCINCAKCVDVCPERLIPKDLADAVEHDDDERFLAQYGMECIDCGSCSYVCPARRHLKELIGGMRKIQLGKRAAAKAKAAK